MLIVVQICKLHANQLLLKTETSNDCHRKLTPEGFMMLSIYPVIRRYRKLLYQAHPILEALMFFHGCVQLYDRLFKMISVFSLLAELRLSLVFCRAAGNEALREQSWLTHDKSDQTQTASQLKDCSVAVTVYFSAIICCMTRLFLVFPQACWDTNVLCTGSMLGDHDPSQSHGIWGPIGLKEGHNIGLPEQMLWLAGLKRRLALLLFLLKPSRGICTAHSNV